MKASYTLALETEIVRRRHEVRVSLGETARSLKASLGNVPNHARVRFEEEDSDGWEVVVLVFDEESDRE